MCDYNARFYGMHSRICVTCDESYNVVKKSYDQRKVGRM